MQIFLLSISATTDFYEKWSNIFSNKHIVWDVFRNIGWLLVKLLLTICNACEDLLEYANKSLSFIASPEVVDFIGQWKYVIYGVLIIAILFFSINMMVNRKQERSKLLQNIVIATLVLMCSTTAIVQLTTNTQSFSLDLLDTSNSTSSEKVIKDAVTDLYYMDENDFSDSSAQQKNVIPATSILNINPTEDIKASDDVENPDIFKYKLNTNGKNGQATLDEIDDGGLVDYNNDTYYRYHIDFTTIIITLLATAIVMIFTAFKVVKIVFDIIVHQILATLMAAGDWTSGQKLKEVIKSLFALFFSVFMCSVMMKLYFMFAAWTSSNIASSTARGFILAFASFAVIDGPNIVEKIFGIDAGLASTFRSVSTLFFGATGAARLTHGAAHTAGNIARGTAHVGGNVGGFLGGVFGRNKSDIANAANQNKSTTNNGKSSTSPDIKESSNNDEPKSNSADNNTQSNNATKTSSRHNSSSDGQSISNRASKQNQHGEYNYWDNKSRNPRSVAGAAVRGKNDGQYWGDKINNASANRRDRQEAKRNAKGDNQ